MAEPLEITLTADLDPIARALGRAPELAYFWLRDWMFRVATDHRKTLLSQKKLKTNRGIRVPRVNENFGDPKNRHITYSVTPTDRRATSAGDAKKKLGELFLDIGTDNKILPLHEFGGIIRPRSKRKLALKLAPAPGKGRIRRTPQQFRARNPKAVLITRKTRSGSLIVYERKRRRDGVRKNRRRQKGTKRQREFKVRDQLIPRYALVDQVKIEPGLNFYSSWDGREAARTQLFSKAADRILRDIARGFTS